METDTRSAIGRLSASVGKEIRKRLIDLDMTQVQLAAKIGENEMWMSRRLRGVQPIDLNDLERIATALDIDVMDLLPRREGRVVTHAGATRVQTTEPKIGLPVRTGPVGPPSRTVPVASIRRPVRLPLAVAAA